MTLDTVHTMLLLQIALGFVFVMILVIGLVASGRSE